MLDVLIEMLVLTAVKIRKRPKGLHVFQNVGK